MAVLPIRKMLSQRTNRSAQEMVPSEASAKRRSSGAASTAKPLPKLPPASQLDYLDPTAERLAERARNREPFSEAFLRRLDIASALVSNPHRTVPPLGIIMAFEREGIRLKGEFALQDRISDVEIQSRACVAYDASLPKPKLLGALKTPSTGDATSSISSRPDTSSSGWI